MKNHISDFSSFGENSSEIANYDYKNNHISKTKNRKYMKIDFSFVSALCASHVNITLLREGWGGFCITLVSNAPMIL